MPRKRVTRRTPVRRRRRSMGQKITSAKMNAAVIGTAKGALGGVLASVLTNTAGNAISPGFAPYTGLAGAVATSLFFKQPEIAMGMAGYAGPKVLQNLPGVGGFLAAGGSYSGVADNMYLSDDTGSIYPPYTLAGYELPGL